MKKLVFNDVKAKELLDIKAMRHVRGGITSGTCGILFYGVELNKNGEKVITGEHVAQCEISKTDVFGLWYEFEKAGRNINWC